jgi:hypothetical protein
LEYQSWEDGIEVEEPSYFRPMNGAEAKKEGGRADGAIDGVV